MRRMPRGEAAAGYGPLLDSLVARMLDPMHKDASNDCVLLRIASA